jgi:alpha-ribazole phosphatase
MTQPPRRAAPSKASPLGAEACGSESADAGLDRRQKRSLWQAAAGTVQRPHEVRSVGAGSLWLVRHAQPLIEPGICYGQLNVPADAQLTQSCAQDLLKVLPRGTAISTSPLQRCELLAQSIIGLQPDLTVKTDPKLQEMHFGQWEGRAWADIDKAELDGWTDDFADYRAGSTGESVRQFMTRVAAAFDDLDPTKDALWVTHAGVIRAATLIASGIRHIRRADEWPTDAPAYGQWCKLTVPTHRNHHGHQP